MTERVDVVVIGMGVGGEELANTLADNGLNVVGIESHLVGGECPYYGCIPTKMMIRADDMLAEGRRIPGFAGDSTVKADWTPVSRRMRDVATDIGAPIRIEAILLSLIVFLGINVAWALMFDEVPAPGHERG